MPKFFRFPWASTGDKTTIPDETDVAGFVSYQQGYGNDYARDPASDPLAKLIERDKMNQLYSDLTENVQYWQIHAFPEYITAAQNGGVPYAYDIDAVVRYDGGAGYKVYQNTVAGNTNLPTGAGWVLKEGIAGLNAPDFVGPVTIDGYNVSPFSGFKNRIINGNFIINQRAYASGTATTTANQYIFDRWRIPTSGQSATFTTSGVVTAPASGIEQVIENLNIVGTTYTLSYTGTATPTVSRSSDNITYTPITPNADGSYTVTSGDYIKVNLASGTVSKVQFEPGSVATPFEHRPVGLELSLCQRYYEMGNAIGHGYIGDGFFSIGSSMKVKKRVSPTMSFFGESLSNLVYNSGSIASETVVRVYTAVTANSNCNGSFTWTASAEL